MEGIQKIEDTKVSPLILEYPVGTKLDYKGALLNVTERKFLGCTGCFFWDSSFDCAQIACCPSERIDGKNVAYIKSGEL